MRRALIVCCIAGVLASVVASAAAASPRADAARKGAEWIAGEQTDDGSFFTSEQRVDQTAETLAAIVAGGVQARPVRRALAYLRKHAAAGATRGAYTGRIVAGLMAAGENPREFAGTDFVAKLDEQYDEESGAYDTENLFTNLMGANGNVVVRKSLPANAVAYIADNACGDGGFGYENGCAKGPDVDTSAWVINVLVAAGRSKDAAVASARSYIASVQQPDGGFGFTMDKSTSSDSTGLVLSAIEALGQSATKTPWRQSDGDDPVKALLGLQDDSGGFRFIASARSPNALSTMNAVPGMAKIAYPIPALVADTKTPAPTTPAAAAPSGTSSPSRSTFPPPLRGAASGSTSTATQASPSAPAGVAAPAASGGNTFVFTPAPSGPFADAASEPAETIPAPVLWAGFGVVVVGAGAGTWLWMRRRTPAP